MPAAMASGTNMSTGAVVVSPVNPAAATPTMVIG
jgi:hypothetical protein